MAEDAVIGRRELMQRVTLVAGAGLVTSSCGKVGPNSAAANGRSPVAADNFAADGRADDSAAIQAALNTSRGQRLQLGPGRYRLERPLYVPPHTELELSTGVSLECAIVGARACIVLGNASRLGSSGGGADTSRVIALAGCRVESLVTNELHDGQQEYAYLEGLFFTAERGATVSSALVDLVSVFVNSGIRDCVMAGNSTATHGLRIAGTARSGFGPVYVENVWVNHSREHNIVVTEHEDRPTSSCCWLTNVTSEHQGSGFHGLFIRGFGGLANVFVRNFHYEHGKEVSSATAAIFVDGVPGFTADGVEILSAPVENKLGVVITDSYLNVRVRVRGVSNTNLVSPVLEDRLHGVRLANIHVGFYESCDPRYGAQVFTHLVQAPGGVSTKVTRGPVTDRDFGAGVLVPDGTLAVDEANSRLYVRVSGTWKYLALK